MADRNGYNPSKLETEEDVCFICKRRTDTARHEIFYGPNRKNSKREGLWINVCPRCHEEIHLNPDGAYFLKKTGQRAFEIWKPRGEFVKIFGRNYLEEEKAEEEEKEDGRTPSNTAT